MILDIGRAVAEASANSIKGRDWLKHERALREFDGMPEDCNSLQRPTGAAWGRDDDGRPVVIDLGDLRVGVDEP